MNLWVPCERASALSTTRLCPPRLSPPTGLVTMRFLAASPVVHKLYNYYNQI
jgi:hypothetical protein